MGSLSFFQFPTVLPQMVVDGAHHDLLGVLPHKTAVKDETDIQMGDQKPPPAAAPPIRPSGKIGTVREHQSGRVTLHIGGITFDVPFFLLRKKKSDA